MRKHKLSLILLVLVMAVTIALTGCGSKPADNQQTSGSQSQGQAAQLDADQTINIVGYDFKSLDASAESDVESFTTFNQVYEGLAREVVNADGTEQTILAGASKMDVSSDGLVYTFTIRDGAKWSDGKPVTAQDYEFSWKRLIDPNNAFDYETFLSMVKNVPEYQDGKASINDVGIKALDDKTFQVTLSTPTPYFEKMISFAGLVPEREDVFKALGQNYGQDYTKMVYNGPFVISDYQKGSKIEYTKNPNYWDAANVKLQKAEAPIVSEPATLIQMFQSKQLDMVGATGDYIAQLDANKDAGGYTHITGTNASSFYIIFNMKNPVFASAKVRQAMSAAFDRQAYLDTVFKRNVPSYGIVPTQILVGDQDYRKNITEPVKSLISSTTDPKALLVEGLKDMGMDTDPSKITLTLLSGPQTSLSSASNQFIQNQFESKLGIKVDIQYAVDSPTYFQSRTKGQFDLCTGGWGADYNDASSYFGIFQSTDGNNNGKYSDKQYDDLVAAAAKETDSAKRLDDYKQAEQILLVTDPAVITTYYQDLQTFKYNYVKGLAQPLFGGYYLLRDAYIQGKK